MTTKEYSIKAPDGSVIKFRAPENAPREKILAFAKKQFESKPKAEEQAETQTQKPKNSGRGIAGQIAISRREKRLNEMAPEQAELIRSMSGAERALVGIGGGFKEVAAGLGLVDIDPTEREAFKNLTETSLAASGGRAVGQAAPFAAGGIGGAMLTKGAPLAAQAGVQGLVGATEGNVIARGTGGTGEDILVGTALGGAIGGGAEVLGPIVNRAARSLVQKVKGKPPAGVLIDDAGKPTKELQNVLDETGQTFDEMVQSAKQGTESVESVVEGGRSGNQKKAVEGVSESINLDRLGAAERLGMEDVPIAVVSDDMATQELGGILSAIPGSQASVALNEMTDQFGRRADQYVEELGGSIDRGMIDQDLLVNMQSDISRIKALEDRLYAPIDETIGLDRDVVEYLGGIKNKLSAKARTAKSVSRLPKHEQDLLKMIGSKEGMSYKNLVDKLAEIDGAAYRKTKAYDTVDTALLKETASDLRRVRQGIADTFGVGNKMRRAKKLGSSRFGLQESVETMFGQNTEKSIFPRIDRTVKGLERGSIREFRATMELIPEKFRKPVAATMLNTALTGGRNQALGVNSGQFAKWYKNLSRNESATNELRKYIGADAMTRLDDIANLAQGVANVTGSRVRTGVAGETLKRLNDIDGIVGKIYGAAQRFQGAPVAGRAAAIIGNTAKTLTMEKTPATEAAQELMGSKKFVDAVKEAARAGTEDRKFRRLNSQLKATPQYKKYLRTINDNAAEQIAASGLIAWLASDKEEQN